MAHKRGRPLASSATFVEGSQPSAVQRDKVLGTPACASPTGAKQTKAPPAHQPEHNQTVLGGMGDPKAREPAKSKRTLLGGMAGQLDQQKDGPVATVARGREAEPGHQICPAAPVTGANRTLLGGVATDLHARNNPIKQGHARHQDRKATMLAGSTAEPPSPPIEPAPAPKKTVLGPSTAPLNPGSSSHIQPKPQRQRKPQPAPREPEPLEAVPGLPRRRFGSPKILRILLPLAAILVAIVAAAAFLFGERKLKAQLTLNEKDHEQLEISCEACDPGTTFILNGAKARLAEGKAVLPLLKPLTVGTNHLTLTLLSPRGSREQVDLEVPLEYRVRGDVTKLVGTEPKLQIDIEALPKTKIRVNNEVVRLDPKGHATYRVDVTSILTGMSAGEEYLKKEIPYSVEPPNGQPRQGHVAFQVPIAPLIVKAPGPQIVLEGDQFMLAGQTAPGAKVMVDDNTITTDSDGRFSELMSVSKAGEIEIEVVAQAPGGAPRIAPIRVHRVADLKHAAKAFRGTATPTYSAIAGTDEDTTGWKVAFEAEVVEARAEHHTSVALVKIISGCEQPPCFAQLVHGRTDELSEEQRIELFGELVGDVEGPRTGTRIPEIQTYFVLTND